MDEPGIFVNLATTDLDRARAFYEKFFSIDDAYSNDDGFCAVVNANAFLMVLRRDFFATFTDKRVVDPRTEAQTAISLSCTSRQEVDAMIATGIAAGGTEPQPAQDYGFMYSRDLDDPDGNSIGFFFMSPDADQS